MAPRESERPQLPWQAPGEEPSAAVLFAFLVLALLAIGVAIFYGAGFLFPS
ncbi:MAG: hypothetical protein M1401_17910 [Chloroflexi bacterium]|nr:hypothetical protein [Chloroflexota bacterium]